LCHQGEASVTLPWFFNQLPSEFEEVAGTEGLFTPEMGKVVWSICAKGTAKSLEYSGVFYLRLSPD